MSRWNLTLTYSLIVRYYLCVPPINGVIDPPLISAGFVFYAWLIFSIFALDWAKSALAGFEAWALMDPRFAPPTALHLMWHTDRAWGSVSGWRDAIVPLCMGVRHRFSKQPTRRVTRGPAGLWWFLAFSSFLFYAAIPLSSLTMEMEPAFKRTVTTEGGREYMNAEAFPSNGSLEIVLWQAYRSPFIADAIYNSLSSHPAVISSVWKDQDTAYLGFGVRCSVDSCTGTADLHVERRSYSNFTARASSPLNISLIAYNGLNSYPGIMALQSIVFAGFTTAVLNVMAPPTCVDGGGLSSVTCNSWYGANLATGGSPYLVQGKEPDPHTQLHTISPARFKLAIHKLFGEATIAMMARGAGAWEGELYGLDPTTALVPGKVPWSIVLTLLILWTAVTSIPSLWVFGRKRWADTLSGFDMFRFGAEWKEAVWQFEENEFETCPILLEVPGMIGDMEANVLDTGFIGLSKDEARKDGSFVFARDAVV